MPRRAALQVGVIGLFALWAQATWAQAGERSAAEALFQEGKSALLRGDLTEACSKLAESDRLEPSLPGTTLALGLCQKKMGELGDAWVTLNRVLMLTAKGRDPRREQAANQLLAEISASSPKLLIRWCEAVVSDLYVIKRDALVVSGMMFGTAVPVNIGVHDIEVYRDNVLVESKQLSIAPGDTITHEVVLCPAAVSPVAAAPKITTQPRPARDAAHSGPRDSEPDRPSGAKTLGVVLFATGLVTTAVGGYFGVRAVQKTKQLDDQCPRNPCPTSLKHLDDEARSSATVANVVVPIGVALIGSGAFLYLSSDDSKSNAQVRLSPAAADVTLSF